MDMARFLFLVCVASAAARKIACYALITMDKTAPKIKYAPRQTNSGLRN
jgi:2-(1,2-epoxy-1,2-dihydrophenyl)acetyl-CoA isomerase